MTDKIRRTCAKPDCTRRIVAPFVLCREHWGALTPEELRLANLFRREVNRG